MGNLHNAIEFQEVSLAFGDRVILDRVSFTVRQGEAKVVMGGSGTGKSTLLRLALGLLKPDAGRILIDGEDVTHYSEEEMMAVRRKIGMVFQEGALFDSLSVYDNVAYRLREQQVPEDEIGPVVLRMLRFVDLEDSAGKMPNELSGGMRRRVGIARALVGNPKIIFYDEPTAGLDPMYVVRDDQGNLLFEQEGERLCLINTRFLMLKDGKIIFSGTDEEIRESSNPYIQKFFT